MALIVPKIIYDAGAGPVTLTFSFPAVQRDADLERMAQRTDSFSTAGKKQSITQRIDKFLNLNVMWVPLADIAAWGAFIDWALLGGTFDYYPDSTSGTHTTYTLEDTSWRPQFNMKGGWYKFTLKFRKAV